MRSGPGDRRYLPREKNELDLRRGFLRTVFFHVGQIALGLACSFRRAAITIARRELVRFLLSFLAWRFHVHVRRIVQ